jgi:hypothetical protein
MRKNHLLLLVLLFSTIGLFGQSPRTSQGKKDGRRLAWAPERQIAFRAEMDTLMPAAFANECAGTAFIFVPNDTWGFVAGMNGYLDFEKAQRLTYSGADPFSVTETWGFFSEAQVVGDGNLRAKIYSVGNDGGPNSLLAASQVLKTSDIVISDTEILPTIFPFVSPVPVSGDAFFTSIDFSELYSAMDTVALFTTDDGCGDGADAWELFGDGQTWVSVDDTDASWGLELNYFLFSVIEFGEDNGNGGMTVTDTLAPPVFDDPCSETAFVFIISDIWGFIAGMNGYGDLEKAQLLNYDGAASYRISEVWAYFSDAIAVGDGSLQAKVYSVSSTNGGPGSLLGTSDPINVSDIIVDPQDVLPTIIPFSNPVSIAEPQFFASIDFSQLYASQDTVGLFMTDEDCGDGSNAWELFSDGQTWLPIDDESSWAIEAEFFIQAVIEFEESTGIDPPHLSQKGLTLFPAYPNPAGDRANLHYALDHSSEVALELYSAEGRLLRRFDAGQQAAGEHTYSLDVSRLPAGSYVYSIITDRTRMLSRVVVGR